MTRGEAIDTLVNVINQDARWVASKIIQLNEGTTAGKQMLAALRDAIAREALKKSLMSAKATDIASEGWVTITPEGQAILNEPCFPEIYNLAELQQNVGG